MKVELDLRPFQRNAVERFFAEEGRHQVIVAPAGAGKGVTAGAIIVEALHRGAAGIMILGTSKLVAQAIASRAASDDLTPYELHRAVAMSTSARPVPRWPERVLAFGSLLQSAREPIAHALRTRHWDLIVADLSGARKEDIDGFQRFLSEASVERVLALDDGLSSPDRWSWLDANPVIFSVHDLAAGPRPVIKFSVVEYENTTQEITFAERAHELAMAYRGLGLRSRLQAAVRSSPLAAQSQAWAAAGRLMPLRNRLAHGLTSEPEWKNANSLGPEALPELERLIADLRKLGDDVDVLEADSKWDAFLEQFRQRDPNQTVVFCDFPETAAYVASRLEAAGIHGIQLVDAASIAEAENNPGAVLVTQDAKLLGLDLRHARLAFNYDLPPSERRALIRWSRLDSFRGDPLEMVTLVDRKSAPDSQEIALAQLRDMVGLD